MVKKGKYLADAPKGDAYDPGKQVSKAIKPGVATSEKIVKNIVE